MVIVVTPGESIQVAINNASPGDTILVRPGVYESSVAVSTGRDRLRIIGAGAGRTVLQGPGLVTDGFVVNATAVTIAGFTVRNFEGDGIYVDSPDNVIRNNIVTGNGAGGIHIDGSRNLIMKNKLIRNTQDGVYVNGGNGSADNYVIANRSLHNGDYGIHADAERTLIMGNKVWSNRLIGIRVHSNADGCWVIDNEAGRNKEEGIGIEDSAQVLVYGNTSRRNFSYGLGFNGLGLVAMDNDLCQNIEAGLYVEGVMGDSIIYSNELSRNYGAGFGIGGAATLHYNTLLYENDIRRNAADGIGMEQGSGNRVMFNSVHGNIGSGIDVSLGSSLNVVDNNFVDYNKAAGIHLDKSVTSNAVRSNTLHNNRPLDMEADPPVETSNTFDLNKCRRSRPRGLCR